MVPEDVPPANVGFRFWIIPPFVITSPVWIWAATNASPEASPVTLIVYFNELSDNNCRVAVPVSFRVARPGFSFFVDKGMLHSLTTVGGGVTTGSSPQEAATRLTKHSKAKLLSLAFVLFMVFFDVVNVFVKGGFRAARRYNQIGWKKFFKKYRPCFLKTPTVQVIVRGRLSKRFQSGRRVSARRKILFSCRP